MSTEEVILESEESDNLPAKIKEEENTTEENVDGEMEDLSENNDSSEISDIENRIIKQVEYYFGDFNLRRDRFLKEQVKVEDGWIPLTTLIKFNRLKSITTDLEQIAKALKKSPNKLMEVSDDKTKIRRNPEKPISENGSYEEEQLKERCVYVKKFPDSVNLDELQEFFKGFGTPENILMRRFQQSKKFKGSVFVTFSLKDDAEKFMNLPSVKFKNIELVKETKKEYTKRKEQEFNKHKEAKEKKLKEKETIQNEMAKEQILKGCLLKLTGLNDALTWEILKSYFNTYAPVAFVDFQKETNEAILRFSNEGDAKVALENAKEAHEEKKLIINDVELSGAIVEGDEEVQYWESFKQAKAARFKNNRKGRKGKRRYNDNSGDTSDSPQKKQKSSM